ncbi:amino acid permease [Hyaloscypha variabilis F]|uniref:Amino acid permease n=1 Tax=Hyaloscypha variabilis (strain UAMH 11265 / GT02V1 / F) TaxID=1149755 RepID=A0A2J6SBK7_HYAVF|nr:amino acid permease [Hyaloscypha variabilis F]
MDSINEKNVATDSELDRTTDEVDAPTHGVASNGNIIDDGLQRGLKGRHLQMIALGGVVGPGIWYGSGFALNNSGPVGALLCFVIIGIDVYFVMQSLGEMSTLFPSPGAFVEMAGRFVDPALAFALGWNYWYLWVTNLAGEYNNLSLAMSFWTNKIPTYGVILVAWAIFQCTSLLGVVTYGEMEFWLASWKFLCVLCGFLIAILINTGAIGGDYIGFRYWKDPGPFAHDGIQGFGQTFLLAALFYSGTEMLAVTAGESANPKRDLPRAIKQTFWRVVIVFVGLLFFSSIIVPSTAPDLLSAKTKSGRSPFTIALVQAGWPGAGQLINVFIITALLSSVNSCIYICSRALVSLAKLGRAPAIFAKTTKNGVPVYAVVFSNFLGLIAMLNYSAGTGQVFTYLVDISGAATFITWGFIGVTHIRMRKAYVAQGYSLNDLSFQALWYPYGAWFIVVINFFLVVISGYKALLSGFHAVDFVFNYIVLVIFVLLYLFWRVFKKTKMVKLLEIDLVSGRREYLRGPDSLLEKKVGLLTKFKRFLLG